MESPSQKKKKKKKEEEEEEEEEVESPISYSCIVSNMNIHLDALQAQKEKKRQQGKSEICSWI